MQKVGNDGVITVEEAKGIKTELNTTSGPGLKALWHVFQPR